MIEGDQPSQQSEQNSTAGWISPGLGGSSTQFMPLPRQASFCGRALAAMAAARRVASEKMNFIVEEDESVC